MSNRNLLLDELRGLAIVFVVISHLLLFVIKVPLDGFALAVVCSFQMPFFMFLSGYSLGLGHNELNFSYVMKRMICLCAPFFSWCFIKGVYGRSFDTMSLILLIPENGLWFLWVLAWITFFIWCGQKLVLLIKNDIGYFIIAFCLVAIDSLFSIQYFGFSNISYFYIFFLVGYKIQVFWWRRSKVFKRSAIAICSVVFFTMLPFWRFPGQILFENDCRHFFNTIHIARRGVFSLILDAGFFFLKKYIIQFAGVVFVVSLYKILRNLLFCKIKQLLAFIGTRTIDIYAMHIFIFLAPFSFSNRWFDAFIKFLLAFLCPLAIGSLIRKSKWCSFMLLGTRPHA